MRVGFLGITLFLPATATEVKHGAIEKVPADVCSEGVCRLGLLLIGRYLNSHFIGNSNSGCSTALHLRAVGNFGTMTNHRTNAIP